jgi:flagellar basal body-associated protein FliL
MQTENVSKEQKGNDANRVLAVVLISLLWIAVLAVGVILAWLFDGEQFLIRCILIQPFSFGALFATRSVWSHYC